MDVLVVDAVQLELGRAAVLRDSLVLRQLPEGVAHAEH